ncbi:tetratricopeptide repeat protein [Paracoccaceae bacterium]|nr:tetratricopeptide repeat protein [Paracoccaceae bacterium]
MSNLTQQSQPPQATVDQIVGLYNQDKLEQTVSLAESLSKQYPNALILYDLLGAAYVGLQNADKTIESYQKALQLNPNHTDAYNNMGMALYDQGRFEEAVESYQKAVKLEPSFADAHYNLGNALNQTGDLKKAIESYRASLEINPNDAEAYYNMGNALRDKGDLDQAVASYKQASAIKLHYIEPYQALKIKVMRAHAICSIGNLNYWAIPKCGNTSIKRFLLQKLNPVILDGLKDFENVNVLVHKHHCFEYLTPLGALSNGKMNFTFVRDPLERFISFYKDFCLKRRNPALSEYHKINIDSALDLLEWQFKNKQELEINPHLRSQNYYLKRFEGHIFKIIEFDSVRVNTTSEMPAINLSEKQIFRIKEIYKDDFQYLNQTSPIQKFQEFFENKF